MRDAFSQTAGALSNGLQQLAGAYARMNFKAPPKCASQGERDQAVNDFIPGCVGALKGQFPEINNGNWAACRFGDQGSMVDQSGYVFDAARPDRPLAKLLPGSGNLFGRNVLGNLQRQLDQAEVQLECQQQMQYCRNYNNTAIQQAQEGIRDSCDGGGPRWDPNADHYGWCMAAPAAWPDAETQARTDALQVCKASFPPEQDAACQSYAWKAVQQARQRESMQTTCAPASGPRWSDDYNQHFVFCSWGFRHNPDVITQVMSESDARDLEINACTPGPCSAARAPSQPGPVVTGPSSGGPGDIFKVMPSGVTMPSPTQTYRRRRARRLQQRVPAREAFPP